MRNWGGEGGREGGGREGEIERERERGGRERQRERQREIERNKEKVNKSRHTCSTCTCMSRFCALWCSIQVILHVHVHAYNTCIYMYLFAGQGNLSIRVSDLVTFIQDDVIPFSGQQNLLVDPHS